MVKEISVPESILEEIARDGDKETERDKEAVGILLGYYSENDNSILVSERLVLPSKKGYGRLNILYERIKVKVLPSYRRRMLDGDAKLGTHIQNVGAEGGIAGLVFYHSHRHNSWSDEDLEVAKQLPEMGFRSASLLYISGSNTFEAINKNQDSIPVLTIKKE